MSSLPSGPSKSNGPRSVGDSPDIGRVSKMRPGFDPRSPGRSGGRRRRSENIKEPLSQTKEFKIIRNAVLIFLGVVAVSVTAWMIFLNVKTPSGNAVSSQPGTKAPVDSPPPSQKLMVKKTKEMVSAKNAADLADVIHLNGKTPDTFYKELERIRAEDGEVQDVAYIGPVQNLTQPLESVLVTFGKGRNRIALFCPDESGDWLIDFDAYARAASQPWERILDAGEVEATVRVYVSLDTYYNGRFSSEDEWSCNGLASNDQGTLMFGYAKKGSNVDQAIRDALDFRMKAGLMENNRLTRMTLVLKHVKGDDARQFEIIRAIADDWATPVRPLDNKYH